MKIKIYYRKSLKMSPGKLAAQVGHVCKELGRAFTGTNSNEDIIVVLQASDTKYFELKKFYLDKAIEEGGYWRKQVDIGCTEIAPGTETCFGYIEE